MAMEILCQSDYQDVYRVKDGVLLTVNKFKRIPNINGRAVVLSYFGRQEQYAEGCHPELKVLTEDFYYGYFNTTFYAGQVLYRGYAVERVDNQEEWEYQIHTFGDSFSAKFGDMLMLLTSIFGQVCESYPVCQDENTP